MYSLCENIDGMDSLIFRFSIESIQLYFENKETEMLKQTQQIKIFSEFKKENLMDIAFMSLSIIAPRIQYKRTDLETELTLVVGAHIDEIISLSNHLLMQRALLFLEVIGFELFQTVKGSQNLIKILEFYYSVITSQNVPPVVSSLLYTPKTHKMEVSYFLVYTHNLSSLLSKPQNASRKSLKMTSTNLLRLL